MKRNWALSLLLSIFLFGCGGQPQEDPDEAPSQTPVQKTPGSITLTGGLSKNFVDTQITQSSQININISNTGGESISSLQFAGLNTVFHFEGGSFPGTGGSCSTSLSAGSSCRVVISFSPTSLGANNLNFQIQFFDSVSSQSINVQLNGNATLPPPPTIIGLSDASTPTNLAELSWSCDQTCEFRSVINQNPTHDFGSSSYGSTTQQTQSSGNGTYYLHVQAKNSDFGVESSVSSISFVMDSTAPTAPSIIDFDLDATETSSSTLNWNPGTDETSLAGYQLAIGTSPGAIDVSDYVDVGDVVSGAVSNLNITDGIDYYTSLRSIDAAGNTSTSVISDAWNVPGPPESINSLAATSAFKTEVRIGWSAPYHNGSAITDYLVEYRPSVPANSDWILLAEGVSTDTTSVITGLDPSTTYEFKVRAYNGSTSPDSNILSVETAPDDPFFEPNVYQAMNLGGATKSVVAAFDDATEIFLNDVSMISLDAGDTYEFDSSQGDVLRSDKGFYVSGRLTVGTPGNNSVQANGNIAWNSPDWAGKEFIFTGTRDPDHIISVYAFEDANIQVLKGATEVANQSLLKGEFHTFNLSSNGGFQILSDGLIMGYMYSSANGTRVTDPKPLLPASHDIIGFASTTARIASATTGNGVTLHHSDGFTSSNTVNAGNDLSISSRGDKNLYKGESLRIIATDVVIANSNADSNGYCSAPFVPTSMLKKKFVLNNLGDYVAFASLEAGDITMEEPDGTTTTVTLTQTGLNPYAPFRARVSNVPAGTKFYSTTRFQAWYQPQGWTDSASDDDETILFGFD